MAGIGHRSTLPHRSGHDLAIGLRQFSKGPSGHPPGLALGTAL